MRHVFQLNNNYLNNRDINIDQNYRYYVLFHNQAALVTVIDEMLLLLSVNIQS